MRDYADALHSRGRPLRPQISPDGGHPGAPKPPPLPRSLRGYRRDSLSPDASRGRRYSRSISPRRSPSPRRRLSHRSRSPPPRVPPSEFYRRDDARWREDYKDRASKTGTKTQPSRDIILLGLDADVDETRLQDMLVGMAGSPDVLATSPVTVIRDRNTGVSKGFGFAKFATLETAITFMDKHAPYLEGTERWTGPPPPGCDGHDTGRRRRIKVDFSQTERPQGRSYYNMHHPPERPESREPANSHEQSRSAGSNVPALQGSAVPTEVGPQSAEGESSRLADNDGMRHIGSEPSTVLLLRGVPSGTSAASLGRKLIGMKDPNWEDRTFAGKLECVFLVRARAARAGELGAPLGFAFARCNDTESAQALLSAAHDPWAFPTGFRISADEENQAESSAVGLTFAADAVFVEVNPDDPRDAAWSFKDRHGKSWLYADEHAGVEVWDASTEASHQRPDSQSEAGPQQAENADATTANGNNSVANSAAPHEPGTVDTFQSCFACGVFFLFFFCFFVLVLSCLH